MLTLSAPAKINTYLHITGQRHDGYHLLDTVFQLVSLYDTVKLQVRNDGQLILNTPIEHLPDEQHLAIRAARLLKTLTQTQLGADIWVEKKIPAGAGLGGGSSDAATTLMGLNLLWGCGLNNAQLQTIGLQLGADVPFFCSQQGTAHAEGVGEILTPLDTPLMHCILIFPNIHVSTPAVFKQFNLTSNKKYTIISELSAQRNSFHFKNLFKNELQETAISLVPSIEAVCKAFQTTDKIKSIKMTGTGSTVFAVYQTEYDAKKALSKLKAVCQEKSWSIWYVHTINSHPNQKELFLG
jgi:4-diphosphocytidyl-2-C-methyl-D-erythritol kinase